MVARAIVALVVCAQGVEAQSGSNSVVRICAGGDVTLGTNLDTLWGKAEARRLAGTGAPMRNPTDLIARILPLFSDADIAMVNVEGAIGDGATAPKCGPRSTNCFAFRQPPVAASALRGLLKQGEVIGNVANNHAGDAGIEGLRATVSYLLGAGVHVTGADTLATFVAAGNGRADMIAFLGFSTSAGPDPRDLDAVRRHVRRAAASSSRVVVTMHMGAEGPGAQRTRDSTERYLGLNRGNVVSFARTAVDAGADLVVGHGPHVMRAAEWRGDALIFYSLGNLLTYGPFSIGEPSNRGAVACVSLDESGRVVEALMRSTRQIAPGLVIPDLSGRAAILVDSLSRLDFPQTRGRWRYEVIARN